MYLLKCADGSVYIGHTDNMSRRLEQHKAGRVTWTRSRLPVELIHAEAFQTRQEAVRREHKLKTGYGRRWIRRQFHVQLERGAQALRLR